MPLSSMIYTYRGYNRAKGHKDWQFATDMMQIVRRGIAITLRMAPEIAARLKHSRLVPIYMGPPFYKTMRKKGITAELRNSVYPLIDTGNLWVTYVWLADHARYISLSSPEKNPLVRRARTPGTSLDWINLILPYIAYETLMQSTQAFFVVGIGHLQLQMNFVQLIIGAGL